MGKWSRRAFIGAGVVAGGGLLIGVAIRPGNRSEELSKHVINDGETFLHTWVKLDSDNLVTAIVPHSEMGQGAGTALAQMLADELDADWNLVRFEEAPAVSGFANYSMGQAILMPDAEVPSFVMPSVDGALIKTAQMLDLQITGGSLSIRSTGTYGMRVAGAAVKQMLREAAAQTWNVPLDEIVARNSVMAHEASGRSAPYSAFAELAAQMVPPSSPKLKSVDQYNIMGRHVDRHDLPAKVDGSAVFAADVRLPNMLYATIKRSPTFTGSIEKLDETGARSIKGVVDVIRLASEEVSSMFGNFTFSESVAVVAEGYWPAKQGLDALKIQWSTTDNNAVSSATIFEQFARDIGASVDRGSDVQQGNVPQALANAATVIEADYQVPFLAHTCMEPLNATAVVKNGRCELWVGCQNPLGFRKSVADALGFDVDNVILHNCLMGGGFGRKSRPDYAIQAAQIAAQVGRPVQLLWTREEDVQQDFYRPAIMSRFRAGLDAEGNIIAWENTYVDKHDPFEASLIPYAIAAQDIGHVSSPTHIPFGAWRSVAHSHQGFFTESFIDEAAAAAGQDPYQYRAALLQHRPRELAVLKAAAEKAQWHKPLPAGRGRGISLHSSFGSVVAEVVEVTVLDGELSVDRVVAVIDAGFAVSPDGVAAQLESGVIYGLTAALYGEISISNGAVEQSNFHDYPSLRMPESPNIETHIINSGATIGGAGEPGTPPIAAALTNAIFNATGKRIRKLPVGTNLS
ncbi:MAG: xanthine dehydrogenase family protein molybdopterin-binding subunit [Porticoccaceae bacterium]|nr:xanthine dehydrogenase family protein molybdopterin-binding subunit [Porticoccaceae bacterium]MBT5578599.1 xanthine dehydrogenase family protein molybdopterin-binding subunit [Porticoccaceae bacterium]